MTLEKAQHNRRIFPAATLVAIAFSPLFVAASGYAQAPINKETTMAQLDTLHLHAVPFVITDDVVHEADAGPNPAKIAITMSRRKPNSHRPVADSE